MDLGAFLISPAVNDTGASRKFYGAFGFEGFGGGAAQTWLIMNVIGRFQEMFEKKMLTFNPGWDNNAQKLATITDVRELQRQLTHTGCNCIKRRTRAPRDQSASPRWTPMPTRSWSISTYARTPPRGAHAIWRRYCR
jgi:lactoylglutathione lyase